LLRIEDLWMLYGRKAVLKGVSLELEDGVGCVLGPNGAGKTTLIKCVAGILTPLRGRVYLDGVELSALSPRERAKLVSYVPQEISIKFPYRTLDIVLMGRNPYISPFATPSRRDEEIALEALRVLGIEHLAQSPFTSLSGGEKRLVLIARALAQGARLLLLDEPTSFLDFRNRIQVMSVIREVVEKTRRLALITLHDPNLASMFCDRVFMLKNGTIIASGGRDIINRETLKRLYEMDVEIVNVGGYPIIVPRTTLDSPS